MAKKDVWSTISLHPLTGPLDVRSDPTEVQPGAWRWKLNMEATSDGRLKRRAGFEHPFASKLYDQWGVPIEQSDDRSGWYYHNHDHHAQGATREPITFLHECTTDSGQRILFDGTQSRLSKLNTTTGHWTDIQLPDVAYGAYGSRWKAAQLQNVLYFTNGVNNILAHDLAAGTTTEVSELKTTIKITAAKIAIEFNGFLVLMNVVQDGVAQPTRIAWSDINDGMAWDPYFDPDADPPEVEPLCGTQDLPYGDDILGAAHILRDVYIYTRRSIWKMTPSTLTADEVFTFTRIYSEPQNQVGCLFYPETLVSTGSEHWYCSREGVYRFDPYIPKPERVDWLHLSTGVMFTDQATAMGGTHCYAPVAALLPSKDEIWFSWPSGTLSVNNWTMVANIKQKTADVVDTGFTAFTNFRDTPTAAGVCNETQYFFGASGVDYAIKNIGGSYYREFLIIDDMSNVTVDLPVDALIGTLYRSDGYVSILRAEAPLGFYDREKRVQQVYVDRETIEETTPPVIRLRLGHSWNRTDPNSTAPKCSPQWNDYENKDLRCEEEFTNTNLTSQKLRQSEGCEWPMYVEGRHIYFEIMISSSTGTAAVGGSAYLMKIDFDAMALQKP